MTNKGNGFDVMGDFNARIGLGAEDNPSCNGKRLLDLVKLGDFVVGNKLQCCEDIGNMGKWGEEIGYILHVWDSGNLDIGSDHNLIWGEVVWGRSEVKVRREPYKWRVDGRLV